jgi:hypothetical protein
MSVSPSSIVEIVVALLQTFLSNNPTAEEIEELLAELLPALVAIQSGSSATIPAFRIGNSLFGPIPVAPYVAPPLTSPVTSTEEGV